MSVESQEHLIEQLIIYVHVYILLYKSVAKEDVLILQDEAVCCIYLTASISDCDIFHTNS